MSRASKEYAYFREILGSKLPRHLSQIIMNLENNLATIARSLFKIVNNYSKKYY